MPYGMLSTKGQIMMALRDAIKALQPEDVSDEEVQARESWLSATGDPHRGISIFDMGEQYDDGTNGTMDVGYICGIMFADYRIVDAPLTRDNAIRWFELCRRRLADQRLRVFDAGITAPKEHVCIMLPGRTITDPNKWPNYLIRQMVVSVWVRELPIS